MTALFAVIIGLAVIGIGLLVLDHTVERFSEWLDEIGRRRWRRARNR